MIVKRLLTPTHNHSCRIVTVQAIDVFREGIASIQLSEPIKRVL